MVDHGSRTGCTLQTLANWQALGKGPAFVRIGRSVRYSRDEVDRLMRSGENGRASRIGPRPAVLFELCFGFGAIQPAKHCGRLRKGYRLVSDAPVACEQAEQVGFFTGAAHCGGRHPNRL